MVQQNLLLLIKEFLPFIPKAQLEEFISFIEGNMISSSSCYQNSWLEYLLRTLKYHINQYNEIKDNCVPFKQDTLEKISKAFDLSLNPSAVVAADKDIVCETSQDGTVPPRSSSKRLLHQDKDTLGKFLSVTVLCKCLTFPLCIIIEPKKAKIDLTIVEESDSHKSTVELICTTASASVENDAGMDVIIEEQTQFVSSLVIVIIVVIILFCIVPLIAKLDQVTKNLILKYVQL